MTESDMWDEVARTLKPVLDRAVQRVLVKVPCRALPQELRSESIAYQYNVSLLAPGASRDMEALADMMLQCWREQHRWRLTSTIWRNNESVFAELEERIVVDPASGGSVRIGVLEEVKSWCREVEAFLETHALDLARSIETQMASSPRGADR